MSEEQPNKKAIQRYWFCQLPEETQERYGDEIIEREFDKAHPEHVDRIRARDDWRNSQSGRLNYPQITIEYSNGQYT